MQSNVFYAVFTDHIRIKCPFYNVGITQFAEERICKFHVAPSLYIPNKSENATLLHLVKMAESVFNSPFFCEIKCLTSNYYLRCTWFSSVLEQMSAKRNVQTVNARK